MLAVITISTDVGVGVAVDVAFGPEVAVGALVGVASGVAVLVGAGVGVLVGAIVGVAVAVGAGVSVAVDVGGAGVGDGRCVVYNRAKCARCESWRLKSCFSVEEVAAGATPVYSKYASTSTVLYGKKTNTSDCLTSVLVKRSPSRCATRVWFVGILMSLSARFAAAAVVKMLTAYPKIV
jgi:hypothetical protein